MKSRFRLAAVVATALALADPGDVAGQSVSSFTPVPITLPTPGNAEFAAGYSGTTSITITTNSQGGRNHNIHLALQEPYASPLPATVQFRVGLAGTWTTLSASNALVSNASANQNVTVYFRKTLTPGTDVPATYTSRVRIQVERVGVGISDTKNADITITIPSLAIDLAAADLAITIPTPGSTERAAGFTAAATTSATITNYSAATWRLVATLTHPYVSDLPEAVDIRVSGGTWQTMTPGVEVVVVAANQDPSEVVAIEVRSAVDNATPEGDYTSLVTLKADNGAGAVHGTDPVDVSLSIPAIAPDLAVGDVSLTIPSPVADDFLTGYTAIETTSVTITNDGGQTWRLGVEFSHPYGTDLPESVEIRVAGGTWQVMDIGNGYLLVDATQDPAETVSIEIRSVFDSTTPVGSYTSRITFLLDNTIGGLHDSESLDVSLTVPEVLYLSLSGNAIDFGTVAASGGNLPTEWPTSPDESTLTYYCNVPCNVIIGPSQDEWTSASGQNDSAIPNFALSFEDAQGFSTMPTAFYTIVRVANGSSEITIPYYLNMQPFGYPLAPPDTYTLPFYYSIMAN